VITKLLNIARGIIGFVRNRTALSVGIAVVVIIVATLVFSGGGDSQYDYVVAEKTNIVQEVNVTGQVKAVQDADLAFEQAGIVSQVLVAVGDEVSAGQMLASLRNSDVEALLSQAEAQVDVEQTTLVTLQSNTRQDLQSSYGDALNTIDNALAKSEDAIRTKASGLFNGSKYTSYYMVGGVCGSVEKTRAEKLRMEAELTLDNWNKEFASLVSPSTEDLDIALAMAKVHLGTVQETVNAINGALSTECTLKDSSLDTARTNMSTAQINISTVTGNIDDLIQTIESNKISTSDVTTQEARVRAAEASVNNYRAQLEKTIIRSPINGVVTKQDARLGETVAVNSPLISVIYESNFEIETFIPEADISKIKNDDPAKVTLDAYGSDELFEATVTAVDLGETVIEGVTTYKTTLRFTQEDERIKPGMTANVDILTASKENVIAVPQRAVITQDGRKFVRILREDGNLEEKTVTTGLRGSDGNIEITEGVNPGDRIVTFIREES